MINSRRLRQNFIQLVKIDSLTYAEKEVVDFIKKVITEAGLPAETRVDEAGAKIGADTGNLIVSLPGNPALPAILFNAHLDTVDPGRGIEPVIENGLIQSAGETILGADDKAGAAAILEMILRLGEKNMVHGPIEAVFTIAEEKGLLGSKNLDFSALKSQYAFVFDSASPVGYVTVQAPYQDSITARFLGKAVHAGVDPEKGVNAIMGAAKAITALRLGRIDEETTANVGVIRGGRAANIVPDRVEIKAEARSLTEAKLKAQTAAMTSAIKAGAASVGVGVEIEVEREYEGFNLSADDYAVKKAVRAVEKIGVKAVLESTGGGADTNVYNARGLAAVGLGVGYLHPHSTQETLPVEQLEKAAELALAIVEAVAADVNHT